MKPIDWAFAYHDCGYNVIPEVDKIPKVSWKKFQTERITIEQIEGWWRKWPDASVGVITGRGTGLCVVDADDERSVVYCNLHLRETPFRVLTSRGSHYLYRLASDGVGCRQLGREGFGFNIDIKGDGGKVTGLGSTHASGHVYALDEGADLIPACDLPIYDPAWFPRPRRASALTAPRSIGSGLVAQDNLSRATAYLGCIQGAGKGGRDCHTHQVAASVVRDFGLTYDQGLSLMIPWNEQGNDPPLPEEDVKRIVKSVLEHGKYAYGAKLA